MELIRKDHASRMDGRQWVEEIGIMNRLYVKAFFASGVQPLPHGWHAEVDSVRKEQNQRVRSRPRSRSIMTMHITQAGKNQQRREGRDARVLEAFFHGCATKAAHAWGSSSRG